MAISGQMIVRIGANTRQLETGLQQAQNSVRGFQSNLNRTMGSIRASTVALGNIMARGFEQLSANIIGYAKNAIQNYTNIESSAMGLQSILNAQGKSFSQAQEFIKSYISDGLIPLEDATTAFKTLSAAGYDLQQTENILLRLKDASAFNRQASLSMGEAVRSASEGIKNENSILVDNSGITKNLSLMWADYARSIGVGVDSLNRQQKIIAVTNGIMEESKLQLGDAAKYSSTLGGQLQVLNSKLTQLSGAFGAVLAPALQAILPYLNSFILTLTESLQVVSKYMQVIFGTSAAQNKQVQTTAKVVTSQTQLGNSIKKAGDKAKGSVAGFDEVNQIQEQLAQNADDATSAISNNPITSANSNGDTSILPSGIEDAVAKIKEFLAPVGQYFQEIGVIFQTFWSGIQPSLQAIGNTLQSLFNPAWIVAKSLISEIAILIKDLISSSLTVLKGSIEVIAGILSGNWLMAWQGTKDVLVGVKDIAVSLITFITNLGNILYTTANQFLTGNKTFQEHKVLIESIASVITLFFLPALIKVGVEAAITGGKLAFEFIAKLAQMGVVALGVAQWNMVALIDSIIKFALEGWKAVASIVAQSAAWIANKVAVIASTVVTAAQTVATTALTAAQWLLNAAMEANPFVLVTTLVAGLTAAIIYLWNNNEGFRNSVTIAWNAIKIVAMDVWNWISDKLSSFWTWIQKTAIPGMTNFKDSVINAFQSMGNIAISVWDGIKLTIKNSINSIIGLINYMVDKYNSISFSIPSITGGQPTTIPVPQIPHIPMLANGGIVSRPTLTMIGEGSYSEAVVPLGGSVFDDLASRLATAMLSSIQMNSATGNSGNAQATFNLDGSQFARAIVPLINKEQSRLGNMAIVQSI